MLLLPILLTGEVNTDSEAFFLMDGGLGGRAAVNDEVREEEDVRCRGGCESCFADGTGGRAVLAGVGLLPAGRREEELAGTCLRWGIGERLLALGALGCEVLSLLIAAVFAELLLVLGGPGALFLFRMPKMGDFLCFLASLAAGF